MAEALPGARGRSEASHRRNAMTESVERLKGLLAKASKLPWEIETEHDPDAEYGSGPDPDRGYDDFIVFDSIGQLLFGTATSDAKCIVEEPHGDEDGYRLAWDETGKANVELIVEAVNALPDLIATIERLPSAAGEGERAKALPPEIAELVLRLGKVEWGQTGLHDAEGHGAHVTESVRITAEHFEQEGPQSMHGLYLEGTETVVCHTGTSPNSPQVARALAGAWNWLVDQAATLPSEPLPASQEEKA
jgi:hypothetical protein